MSRSGHGTGETLRTPELLMSMLEKAGDPVSRNWLLQRMNESGRTTSRARLNRALEYCLEHGLAIEGPKGIQWTQTTSPSLRHAVAKGKRL